MDDITTSICHEYGHILAFLLTGGKVADVYDVEIIDDGATVGGHTTFNPLFDMTDRQRAFVLFGGIAAENVCGYSTAFLHRGTDAAKLNKIMPRQQQKAVKREVLTALQPWKTAINDLTRATVADYVKQGKPQYYRLFHDSIITNINLFCKGIDAPPVV